MSLLKLAPELILQVVGYLEDDVDIQILRITHSFFNDFLGPPSPEQRRITQPELFRRVPGRSQQKHAISQRLTYLGRLFRPENLFDTASPQAKSLCGKCTYIKSASEFPVKVKYDDYDICESCIVETLGKSMDHGCKQTYQGEEMYVCAGCKEILSEKHMQSLFHMSRRCERRRGFSANIVSENGRLVSRLFQGFVGTPIPVWRP